MVMTNEGLNAIRDLINTNVDKGQLGTGTTRASEQDTDLETKKASTDLTLDSKTTLDKQITFTYKRAATDPNDTYTEFKLYDSSNSNDYDRIIFTGVTTTNAKELFIIKRYFIRNA